MPQVDPKLTFWFGVLTSILLGVGSNAVHLPAGISPEIASEITSWCSFFGWINTMILTAGSGLSGPKSGPLVPGPK